MTSNLKHKPKISKPCKGETLSIPWYSSDPNTISDFLDMEEVRTISAGKRIAVVTGGNKGIGLEICRQLASKGVFVILTARDAKRGTETVDTLKASGFSNVIFHQLDVKDPTSIASLADFIKISFGKLDILVNNAAVGLLANGEALKAFMIRHDKVTSDNLEFLNGVFDQSIERAEDCLKTNYYGVKGVTEALLPCLQLSDSARIVNITSIVGQLKFIPNEKIRADLNNVECLTIEKVEELLQWFLKDVKDGKLQENGWPTIMPAYEMSKVAVNAYTRILAREFPSMLINCVHPGYVKTDMTLDIGQRTAEEGARGPVMLALFPDNGPSGQYFDEMNLSIF